MLTDLDFPYVAVFWLLGLDPKRVTHPDQMASSRMSILGQGILLG
jgi:hypothetical protein